MYRQFCKNLTNFININQRGDGKPNYRLDVALRILPIANINSYLEYKNINDPRYTEINSLLYSLSQFSDKYPSLKKFIWELWAYGFDVEQHDASRPRDCEDMDEIAKMVDLLLGTHYF